MDCFPPSLVTENDKNIIENKMNIINENSSIRM